MKICWDNLEGVRLSRTNNFTIGQTTYIEIEACRRCGEPYLTIRCQQSNFCSRSCASKDRKFSSETRKKLSEASKGKNNPNYGKTHSKETRRKISEALTGLLVGEKNDMYGKTHSEENKKKFFDRAKGNKWALGKRYKSSDHPNWKGGVVKKGLPLFDTYAHQIEYAHEVRSTIKDGIKLLEVRCKNCNNWFVPNTNSVQRRIQSLIGKSGGENNFYCSNKCKNNCSVFYQQKWPKNYKPYEMSKSIWYTDAELKVWREEVLKRANYKCEYCGKEATVAHHTRPKKLEPFSALDPDHGLACCEKCHYKYGHQGECNTANLARIRCK